MLGQSKTEPINTQPLISAITSCIYLWFPVKSMHLIRVKVDLKNMIHKDILIVVFINTDEQRINCRYGKTFMVHILAYTKLHPEIQVNFHNLTTCTDHWPGISNLCAISALAPLLLLFWLLICNKQHTNHTVSFPNTKVIH